MMNIKKLIIIGGDERQKYTAQFLYKKGFDITVFGFLDIEEFPEIKLIDSNELDKSLFSFDAVILPLPVTRDNENIILQKGGLSIDYLLSKLRPDQIVFAGMMRDDLKSKFFKKGIRVFDYFEREDLKVNNAFPTAQGVLKLILDNLPICLNRMKIAVTGCGRTAKMTASMLNSLGADVAISARKCSDLAWAQNNKMHGIFLKDLYKSAHDFDVLINTIPHPVIGENIISKLNPDCLLIEIASKPYGIDFNSAQKYKIKFIKAGSLPGKTAPKTAGEIISSTILNIIREGR